jgi:formiminotetrahydrofolate cyclodeaminase
MTIMILISALVSVFIIGAFLAGVLIGAKLSFHPNKRSREWLDASEDGMTEEERKAVLAIKQRLKEDSEAFRTMMGYNQGMAYGMHSKDGELK